MEKSKRCLVKHVATKNLVVTMTTMLIRYLSDGYASRTINNGTPYTAKA